MRLRRLSLAEIARRRGDAARDRDLLESGWTPDARTLATAPLLDAWVETTYPGTREPALAGRVLGHPLLADGPALTSPIVARGPGWVRTEGRFYRLGERCPDPPVSPIKEVVQHWTDTPSVSIPMKGPGPDYPGDPDLPDPEPGPDGFVGF